MAVEVGLTYAQAKKLLELADNAGKTAKVRTFRKTDSRHSGRAFLISLPTEDTAIIRPFNHKKQEIVDLSTLRFWKSGCEFDIEEARNMGTTVQLGSARISIPTMTSTRYVILNKTKRQVWGGEQTRWISNLGSSISWSDKNLGGATLQRVKKECPNDQIEIISREEALDFVTRKEEKSIDPVPLALKTEEKSLETPLPPLPLAVPIAATGDEINDSEIDAILKFDPDAITKAKLAVSQAHQSVKEAEQILLEEKRKLSEAIRHFQLTASSFVGQARGMAETASKTSGENTKRSPLGRGQLQEAILNVLKEHPGITTTKLVDAVLEIHPTSTRGSVKQKVYTLSATRNIFSENGGWKINP